MHSREGGTTPPSILERSTLRSFQGKEGAQIPGRKVQGLRPSAALSASLGVAQPAKEMCQDKPVTPLLPPVLRGTASPCPTWLLFLQALHPFRRCGRCAYAPGLLRLQGCRAFRAARKQPSASAPVCWRRGCRIPPHQCVRQSFRLPLAQALPLLQHCLPPSHASRHPQRREAPLSPAFGPSRLPFVSATAWAVPAQTPERVCLHPPPDTLRGQRSTAFRVIDV